MKPSLLGIVVAVFLVGGLVTLAGIPEPDNVLYGPVYFDGVLQTATDPVKAEVIARVDGVTNPVGVYTMADNGDAGDNYVLRIRLESLADG